MATPKKRSGSKRGIRRRRPSVVMLVVLAALVAGFVTRRLMLPSAVNYLAHRPPDHPSPAAQIDLASPEADHGNGDHGDSVAAREPAHPEAAASPPSSEHLTARDKKQLDDILQRKTK